MFHFHNIDWNNWQEILKSRGYWYQNILFFTNYKLVFCVWHNVMFRGDECNFPCDGFSLSLWQYTCSLWSRCLMEYTRPILIPWSCISSLSISYTYLWTTPDLPTLDGPAGQRLYVTGSHDQQYTTRYHTTDRDLQTTPVPSLISPSKTWKTLKQLFISSLNKRQGSPLFCQSCARVFLQELEPLDVGYLNLYTVSVYKLTTSWCLVSTMRIPWCEHTKEHSRAS